MAAPKMKYNNGYAKCVSCGKYINLETEKYEIYTSGGRHYHFKLFCRSNRNMCPPRIRYASHGKKGRMQRQAEATYY